jgi:putative membrane protein
MRCDQTPLERRAAARHLPRRMTAAAATPETTDMSDWLWYGALLILGGFLYFYCAVFPAEAPLWLPWEFSWPVYLATLLALFWYFRGLRNAAAEDRPPRWRSISFVTGMGLIYVVLQTHVDYYAQHMFFVHRWAHFVLHHTGPFLIALGCAGPVIRAGMPQFLKPVIDNRPVRAAMDILQNPVVAPVLFVGLLYFWLIPHVHTQVMLDIGLYNIMNWSMAINGIMFWTLIVDPRPAPPARLSPLIRGLLILVITLPQMLLGAILTLSQTDYYPVYKICGRVLPFSALSDQHYGGLIIWLPGVMMSLLAMIVVLVNMRINEEKEEHAQNHS